MPLAASHFFDSLRDSKCEATSGRCHPVDGYPSPRSPQTISHPPLARS